MTPDDLLARAAGVRGVYAAAFGRPPWNETADHADAYLGRLAEDARRPGFTAALAEAPDGRTIGFATGWTTPTPFPADRLHPVVRRALGDRHTEAWLCGARKVDELAVHPAHAGHGLGRALLDAVTADAPDGRCWLLATVEEGGPIAFYRRLGWRQLTGPVAGPGSPVVLVDPRHPAAPGPQDA
ncbi:GNAT family N-acetyltransferase [Kitasatospora sp. NPDC054939]